MEEIRRRMNIFSAISAVAVILLIILLCQYIKAHPAQDVNNIYARSATVSMAMSNSTQMARAINGVLQTKMCPLVTRFFW